MDPSAPQSGEIVTSNKERNKINSNIHSNKSNNLNCPNNNNNLSNSNPLNNNINENEYNSFPIKSDEITNTLNRISNNINNNNNTTNIINKSEYVEEIKKVMVYSKKLKIDITCSGTSPKNETIIIEPLGLMQDSLRKERDGFCYFGYNILNDNKDQDIDILISPKDDNFDDRFIGRHFQIRFNPLDMAYYIRDLGRGFGTFMKVEQEIEIKDNYLINIGNSFIVCTFGGDDFYMGEVQSVNEYDNKNLTIKVFSGNKQQIFDNLLPNSDQVITIGREHNCEIAIDDALLSRTHCTIFYKEKGGWYLKDGNSINNYENKPSTNGTWLYLMDELKVYDGMIFKGNQNLFECQLISS